MDQSSNDAEKRNWRERLGIGAKELPKIAGEFAKPAEPVLVTPKSKSEPVVVAKPAPMAPRVATRPAPTTVAAQPAARPPAAPAARPAPSAPAASPDVLAEKLRHQREAAEKLAEQRVHSAKEKPDAQRPSAPPAGAAPAPQGAAARPPGNGAGKPKFSFAEDDSRQVEPPKRDPRTAPPPGRPSASPQARPGQPPQLSPARPPLGGERIITPQVPPPTRQAAPPQQGKPGFNPQFRPQAPQPQPAAAPPQYRPIDPATGFTPLPPSFNMPPRGPTTTNVVPRPMPAPPPPGMSLDPRLQQSPYMPGDPYAPPMGVRPPVQTPMPRYDQLPPPQQQMRGDQLRPATHSYEGDYADDIFEDPAPKAIRRASLNDYSQAYHPDQDMDYGAPSRRRSSGPIILLSLLFLAAVVGIGGVFYYKKFINGGATATSGDAPVIATPAEPAKVSPQQAVQDQGASAGGVPAQPSKKQIYDRIVGDREVLGGAAQIVPSVETPVQPAPLEATDPAAIPAPVPGAPAAQTGDEPLPLPMPPPVQNSDQQGALPVVPQAGQQVAATAIPQVPSTSGQTAAPAGYTQDQTDQMAAASQQKTVIEDAPAAVPEAPATVDDSAGSAAVAEPAQPKPAAKAKPKAAAAAPKKKVAATKKLGAKPVVLVPEQNDTGIDAATEDAPLTIDNEPPLQAAPAPVEQPVKKKKTLLGMFNGDNKQIDEQAANAPVEQAPAVAPAAKPKQQIAAAELPPVVAEPLPRARAVTGNRYVLQLASYSSQAEAKQAYSKMANNAAVSSLSPTITPVSIGGSTRYRLSLGPVATSEQAASACAKLAGAGQPDCVVKREGQ